METESLPSAPPPPPIRRPDLGNMEKDRLIPSSSRYQPRIIGASLCNLGNTCFLNAVLQCITHTVPLVQKLRSIDHSPPCAGDNWGFCSLCALRDHVERCLYMSGWVVSPTSFANNLTNISPNFMPDQQEDAHEFLQGLLNSIHSCCFDPKGRTPSMEEDSLVKQVFGGRLRSQLRCCDCGHVSDTYEPLLDLSLEIGGVESVTDALKSFTNVEKIEAHFTCEGCKSQVSVEKQLKLDQVPEVLALHLKRFKSEGLFYFSKIDKFVEYPLELDLKPFVSFSENDEQLKYELYAVVMHWGSACGGHYNCTIRSSPTAWHLMDDAKVSRVPEATVLDQKAYILFYIKQGSSPWFSSLMETQEILLGPNIDTDASPTSVLEHRYRDTVPRSVGESSCSSIAETPEKDENLYVCTDASPDSARDEAESDHIFSPPRVSNHSSSDREAGEAATNRFSTEPTRRPNSDHSALIELWEDFSEDEKENFQIPQAHLRSRGIREVVQPAYKAVKDTPANESFRRLVRGMPSSRRSSLLACLPQPSRSSSQCPLTMKSRPLMKKRRKLHLNSHSLDVKNSSPCSPLMASQLTPRSHKSLSPRSINRGLFKDDFDVDLQFDTQQPDNDKNQPSS